MFTNDKMSLFTLRECLPTFNYWTYAYEDYHMIICERHIKTVRPAGGFEEQNLRHARELENSLQLHQFQRS